MAGIPRHGDEDVTIIEYASSSRDTRGIITPGAESTRTIRGQVTQANQEELEILDEGMKSFRVKKLLTQEKLNVFKQGETDRATRFEYDGEEYEIQERIDRNNPSECRGLSYWVYLGTEVSEG